MDIYIYMVCIYIYINGVYICIYINGVYIYIHVYIYINGVYIYIYLNGVYIYSINLNYWRNVQVPTKRFRFVEHHLAGAEDHQTWP